MRNYLRFSVCGEASLLLYIFVSLLPAVASLGFTWWMGNWAEKDLDEQQRSIYPWVLLAILIALFFANFIRESTVFLTFLLSTSNIHYEMCKKVLSAKIVFFDSNPVGRILTRFSKDMAVLDLVLPAISIIMTYGLFRALTVTISLVIVNPWLLIPTFASCCYIAYLMRAPSRVMLEAQRIDAVQRGPIHNSFTTLINGLVSIRAYD